MFKKIILSLFVLTLVFSFSFAAVEASAESFDSDVVVVGGGGAGLTAAVAAAENGASVTLVEKNGFLGGNTRYATGIIFSSGTLKSLENGYYQKPQKIAEIILESDSKNLANEKLVRSFAAESGAAVNWLDSQGVEFFPVKAPGYSHGVKPDGSGLISALEEKANELNVEILTDTKAISLIKEDGKVSGIRAERENENIEIYGNSVVLATGGFAANKDMVEKYRPEYADLPVACVETSKGEGIQMAMDVEADVVDMSQLMPIPTVEVETERLITAMMRSASGSSILVNENAERFADETKLYEPLTQDVLRVIENQNENYVYQIFDATAIEEVPIAENYLNMAVKADSIDQLAEKLDLNTENLKSTVEEFNALVEEGRADKSGVQLHPLNNAPYYALKVTPGILSSRGGLRINENSQVLNSSGEAIPGLFAAGETVGGVFGSGYKGGGFFMEAVVSGRIAGIKAAVNSLVD